MLTVILTGLGSRFSRPVDSHFDGLRIRGDLGWRRGHGDCQRETLPWSNKTKKGLLSFYSFFLEQSWIGAKVRGREWPAETRF